MPKEPETRRNPGEAVVIAVPTSPRAAQDLASTRAK
jgi:hypothetical protein